MTAPTAPPPGPAAAGPATTVDERAAFGAVYRLLLRSVATPGRLIAIGLLALISFGLALLVRVFGQPDDALEAATGYVNGNLTTLVPVAVLVFGAATLGDLVDDGSLVYLWLRPVRMRVHVVAAWAATVTLCLPLVGVPVVLAGIILHPDGGLVAGAVLGVAIAIVTYSAIFVLAGVWIRRALPWGLVYILIWEGFVAAAGETASKLAVRSYIRSILSELTGESLKLGEFTLASAIAVPLLVTVAALAFAARRLGRANVA